MPFSATERLSPLLQIRVFQPGAEPYFGPGGDAGFNWYSVLENEWPFGVFQQQTAFGIAGIPETVPLLEYIGKDRMRAGNRDSDREFPIGLVNKPFVIPLDVGTWSALPWDGGTWETARAYRNPPVTMLCQLYQGVDDAGDTTLTPWGRESSYAHPGGSSFAFTVLLPSVSPEYDELVGGVPFVQFGWSGGTWGVRFYHHGNPVLMHDTGSGPVPVMELSPPAKLSYGDDPDLILGIVRVQRGGLLISLDNGASYDCCFDPSGAAVVVPGGKFRFTGSGGAAAVGVHRVAYAAGYYDSPRMPMERSRTGVPSAVRIFAANQTGASCAIVNRAPTGGTTYMAYRATLTPGNVVSDGRQYGYSPEVYCIEWNWPTVPSFYMPIHDGGINFEGRIQRLKVSKPFELDQATCSWTARFTVAEGGPLIDFSKRLIQVWGGWLYCDGTNDMRLLFTGYITGQSAEQIDPYRVMCEFQAESTALRPREMQWRDSNVVPYDGLTVNQAFVKWANSMGLGAAFIAPWPTGDVIVVNPDFIPENPGYAGSVGEPRWGIMEDIAEYAQLELGVLTDGSYAMVPNNVFNFTPYTWEAQALNPTNSHIEGVSHESRIHERFTGVLARGKTPWKERISRWIFDAAAETDITSPRFQPWPKWHVETVDHPVSPRWLEQIALGQAFQKITSWSDIRLKGHLATFVSRRDIIWALGTYVGAKTTTQVGVLELEHNFDKAAPLMAWTEVTGRVL